jgi:hypothetical protein
MPLPTDPLAERRLRPFFFEPFLADEERLLLLAPRLPVRRGDDSVLLLRFFAPLPVFLPFCALAVLRALLLLPRLDELLTLFPRL